MKLLLALAPLVCAVQFSTLRYGLNKTGMKISNPLMETQLESSAICGIRCEQKSGCYTFSVTKNSGDVNCRLGGWKPMLAPDPNSEYFVSPAIPTAHTLYKTGMKISNPLMETQLVTSTMCGYQCLQESGCYTFSETKNSGGVNCRLGGWKPVLVPDPNSEYFVSAIPTEYKRVGTTTRYVKMEYEPWIKATNPSYVNKNWNQSLAACQVDGGWLVVDNDSTIHNYLYNILMANGIYPGYKCLWIGGYRTKITLTGLGQYNFGNGHPDGGGGCLHFYAQYGSDCCGLWSDWGCAGTWDGYFCEIQLP
ncbi:unnamed protein product [Darwinula stevensoni]|uniref:Uncharacterized protein n=1 Tax=Darwinula stevensoni TaxID=69355 RepID=A0A7R9ADQ3_9CRUS|nr:unnamed protein product [Darwinula stevensoni]CAG0901522.1 unnamed protein product [Darwinula stevensoni]